MKNYKLLILTCLLMTISIFIYVGCTKSDSKTKPQISIANTAASNTANNSLFQNHVQTETQLSANSEILASLYNSEAWKTIPSNVLNDLKANQNHKLVTYDNTKVQTIIFDMVSNNSNMRYKSLVIYVFNGNFLPIIIQNEMLASGNNQISFIDLKGNNYLDFQVDKNNKFGKFAAKKDIPFEKISGIKTTSPSINAPASDVAESPTCMQKTSSFSSCMNCLVAECTADWSCAIGCAVEAPACAALMVIACGVSNA